MVVGVVAAKAASGAVFYRFRDASGRLHIVDSLADVPTAQRTQAERVQYDEESSLNGLPALGTLSPWQVFGLGALTAVLVVFALRRLPRVSSWVLRLAIVAGVGALVSGAYFGWLRHTTGLGSSALATPTALIDDAKSAVDKMNARLKAQQEELKEAAQAK